MFSPVSQGDCNGILQNTLSPLSFILLNCIFIIIIEQNTISDRENVFMFLADALIFIITTNVLR
jgi:hypothetical protein